MLCWRWCPSLLLTEFIESSEPLVISVHVYLSPQDVPLSREPSLCLTSCSNILPVSGWVVYTYEIKILATLKQFKWMHRTLLSAYCEQNTMPCPAEDKDCTWKHMSSKAQWARIWHCDGYRMVFLLEFAVQTRVKLECEAGKQLAAFLLPSLCPFSYGSSWERGTATCCGWELVVGLLSSAMLSPFRNWLFEVNV